MYSQVANTSDSAQISANTYSTEKGDIETTINYYAEDSIYFDVKKQVVYLFGGVNSKNEPLAYVKYGDIELKAAYIEINWADNLIKGRGLINEEGQYIGFPRYKDLKQGDEYTMDSLDYGIKTRRALSTHIYSQQSKDEHIKGDKVLLNENGELLIQDGKFCPCEDPDASTFIKAGKIKVIPGKRVVTGPFQLWIADLPTPLFLPFGLFPISQQRTSGVMIPNYGEDINRGFYLRDGGYYWAINDKNDLQLLGNMYTKGGWGINTKYHYKDRYRYDGNLDLRYNKRINFSDEVLNRAEQNDFWLSWSHKPKARGGKRFTSSVEAGTSTYNASNSNLTNNYLSTNFKSSISYYTPFKNTPFSMGVNFRHNQNTVTEIINFTLPEVNLSMNRQYPFKNLKTPFKPINNFIKTINFSYRYDIRNEISNAPVNSSFPFTVANPDSTDSDTLEIKPDHFQALLDRARFGMKHTIPISGSMSIGAIKINPSFNLTAYGYTKQLDYAYSAADSAVNVFHQQGLTHTINYNASVSANTRVYALYKLKGARQPAIRQIMTPNISYSYKPDFGEDRFGYYQNVRTNEDFDSTIVSRYNGFIFGTPSRGKQSSVGFSLQNVFEMRKNEKVDPNDSTGTKHLNEDGSIKRTKPKKLLSSLNMSSSYNFAADSLKLAVFNLSARTDIDIRKTRLNVNFRSSFDPYIYDSIGTTQRRVDRFAIDQGQGLAKLTSANLSLSTNLNQNALKREIQQDEVDPSIDPDYIDFINNNQDLYVSWDVPWSLNMSYNISYSKVGFAEQKLTQSFTVSGDLSLTEKWKLSASSGYDFVNKKLTYTVVNVRRDLNCWEMSFRWIPFGYRQSYNFAINIKSQILKDLKLSRRRDWTDRNF